MERDPEVIDSLGQMIGVNIFEPNVGKDSYPCLLELVGLAHGMRRYINLGCDKTTLTT